MIPQIPCTLSKSSDLTKLASSVYYWAPTLKDVHSMKVATTILDTHVTRPMSYPLRSTAGALYKVHTRLWRSVLHKISLTQSTMTTWWTTSTHTSKVTRHTVSALRDYDFYKRPTSRDTTGDICGSLQGSTSCYASSHHRPIQRPLLEPPADYEECRTRIRLTCWLGKAKLSY